MTTEYFSLDRRGFYKTGGTLDLFLQNPLSTSLLSVEDFITHNDLGVHIAKLFPDGLSLHGWDYMTRHTDFLTSQGNTYAHYDITLELILEYVRRSAFSNCPSRLQAYFAFSSLEDVIDFRTRNGSGASNQPIYHLQADKVVKVDQRWLRLGNQNAIGSYAAHKFWSGAAATNPNWEYMLVTPVHVLEQVL